MAEDAPTKESLRQENGDSLPPAKKTKSSHVKSGSTATITSTTDHDLILDEPLDYPRRRAVVACEICRSRKSKCDGGRPKCKLCTELNAVCIYREPGIKLDAGDRLILDRLANIEGLLRTTLQSPSSAYQPSPAYQPTPVPPIAPVLPALSTASPSTSHAASDDINYRKFAGNGAGSIPLSGFGISQAATNISTMPKAHTTPALHLLQWPIICDLVPSQCDPQVLLQLEMARPPLEIQAPYSLDLSEQTFVYAQAFFEKVNVWYAVVNPHTWQALYRSASTSSFRSGSESCVVLLVLALGQAAHTQTSMSSLTPHQRPTGFSYFEAAWQILPNMMLRNDVASVQAHILAAAYLLYLVRPLEAWNILCAVSIKVQLLLSSPSAIASDDAQNLLERIYWNTLMFESDLLAELDLPHSGIVQFEESVSLPRSFPLPPISPSLTSPSSPTQPLASDDIWYFLSEIALRRLLNRVSHLLYSRPLSLAALIPLVAELDLQLTQWHAHLPPSMQFPIQPSSDSQSQPLSSAQTVLRLRYHACRTIIHRPYILYVLSSTTPTLGPTPSHISEACATGLQSAYLQLSLLSSHREGHMPYLYQGFLSVVSQTLLLLGASLHPDLRKLMPVAKGVVEDTVERVRKETDSLGRLAPSLGVSGGILSEAVERWKVRIADVTW